MHIGILGSGLMGAKLGTIWARAGHEVVFSYARNKEKLQKLARALVTIASEAQPPRRFIAGADAIALAEQHVADLQAQIDAHRELSTSLALDEPALVGTVR